MEANFDYKDSYGMNRIYNKLECYFIIDSFKLYFKAH